MVFAADIYSPEQWSGFFLLVGTASVTLTGLVFVALSLNLKTIAVDATHRFRAIGTLTGLAAVFLRCALVIMGGQNHKSVGAELLAGSLFGAIVYVNGYVQAYKAGSLVRNFTRTTTGTTLYMVEMLGAIVLLCGSITGLYLAAIAMVVNTCYMITGAWLLVMSVGNKTKL